MSYKMQLTDWKKRRKEIVRLYKKGKTYAEIGSMYNITRARVRALVIKEIGKENMQKRTPGVKAKNNKKTVKCA